MVYSQCCMLYGFEQIYYDMFLPKLPWRLSGKESACRCRKHGFKYWVRKIPLEKELTSYFSILAWETPRTEEPDGLWSMGWEKS